MIRDLPPLSEALVRNLEERFPDRCPDVLDTERRIWMDAGAAALVRFLRQELERQKRDGVLSGLEPLNL